jgi:hypothetical protein
MQFFMALHKTYIITIQEPIDLLSAQRHQLIAGTRPTEFFFGKALVIERGFNSLVQLVGPFRKTLDWVF